MELHAFKKINDGFKEAIRKDYKRAKAEVLNKTNDDESVANFISATMWHTDQRNLPKKMAKFLSKIPPNSLLAKKLIEAIDFFIEESNSPKKINRPIRKFQQSVGGIDQTTSLKEMTSNILEVVRRSPKRKCESRAGIQQMHKLNKG